MQEKWKYYLLTSRLTKCEAFNLFERDPAKQMEFASLEAIKEKAEAGMLTYDELNSLLVLVMQKMQYTIL